MTSIKKIFAAVAALAVVATTPLASAAMEQGYKGPAKEALKELHQDNWEPLAAGVIPLREAMGAVPEEGTADEALLPPNPIMMIFNQKGTDKWRLTMMQGDVMSMPVEGNGLTITPAGEGKTIAISYKPAVAMTPVQAMQAPCAPAEEMDKVLAAGGAGKAIEGAEKDGTGVVAFYVDSAPGSTNWALTRTDTNRITCIKMMGTGYRLNDQHPGFMPEWKRNQQAPAPTN